ncbi:hypothetical protein NPIL_205011 [Nephila pilipes]|uniref:Uncharacterized protein n=1 Tax=Nephila pilipes TaxID=299642 RepID=A0A8X6UUK1_NEPPI|nr:hypothetical protein NPIL_205011 [Nephila pilipes]
MKLSFLKEIDGYEWNGSMDMEFKRAFSEVLFITVGIQLLKILRTFLYSTRSTTCFLQRMEKICVHPVSSILC